MGVFYDKIILAKSFRQEEIMEKYLPVIKRGQILRLAVDNIIYIVKIGRKLQIVTTEGTWEYYEHIENLFPFLDSRFYLCMKSLLINLEQVEKMEAQSLFFRNGEIFRLGRDNYVRTRQRYAAWLKGWIG